VNRALEVIQKPPNTTAMTHSAANSTTLTLHQIKHVKLVSPWPQSTFVNPQTNTLLKARRKEEINPRCESLPQKKKNPSTKSKQTQTEKIIGQFSSTTDDKPLMLHVQTNYCT